uniref:HMG box domain-containing protein n=1 Tax=Anopheles funestus TaxID=62324 RepID=A0A182RPP2_ANOFN
MSCILPCCVSVLKDLVNLTERIRNFANSVVHAAPMTSPKNNRKTRLEMAEASGETSTPRAGAMVCKPGKKTRNPYLNFLRDFRIKNCHLSVVEIVRQGAEQWRRMTDEQKLPYVKVAFYTPLKRRRCPSCSARFGSMKTQRRAIVRRKPMIGGVRVKRENQSKGGRR